MRVILPKVTEQNITQKVIRSFVPIVNYDEALGVLGMYSRLNSSDDAIISRVALYVVIDPMKIAIDQDTLHEFFFIPSERIILCEDKIVIVYCLDNYIIDVHRILNGKFSEVSPDGKEKLLSGIPEKIQDGDFTRRDSRWSVFYPTKRELDKACDNFGVKRGTIKELFSSPNLENETFIIQIEEHIFNMLYAN